MQGFEACTCRQVDNDPRQTPGQGRKHKISSSKSKIVDHQLLFATRFLDFDQQCTVSFEVSYYRSFTQLASVYLNTSRWMFFNDDGTYEASTAENDST